MKTRVHLEIETEGKLCALTCPELRRGSMSFQYSCALFSEPYHNNDGGIAWEKLVEDDENNQAPFRSKRCLESEGVQLTLEMPEKPGDR